MRNNKFNQSLLDGIQDVTSRRLPNKTLGLAILFLVICAGAIVGLTQVDSVYSENLFSLLLLITIASFMLVIVTVTFSKPDIKYLPNGQRIYGFSFLLTAAPMDKIVEAIKNHDSEYLEPLLTNDKKGIKISAASTPDHTLSRYRIFGYIEFKFREQTPCIDVDVETIRFLAGLKKKWDEIE